MEIGNFTEKRIQNNDSEDNPGPWENNREDTRHVYQRPRRTKEQTEVNTLEGINSRITEEEQINDLADRMVKTTAVEQNIEKKKMKTA